MPFSHFVAKLTIGGGPLPSEELPRLVERIQNQSDHIAWLAIPNALDDFERAGNSICILFCITEGRAPIQAVIARILNKETSGRPDGTDRKFYADWPKLNRWWPLGGLRGTTKPDVVITEFASLDEIPGHGWKSELNAGEIFGQSQTTITGWTFPEAFGTLGWIQRLAESR
jgi:hypothetical protein